VLEVKGDFIQLVTRIEIIFMRQGSTKSRFNILELRNYSGDGVEFNQPLNANTFIDNGCKVKFAGSGAIVKRA